MEDILNKFQSALQDLAIDIENMRDQLQQAIDSKKEEEENTSDFTNCGVCKFLNEKNDTFCISPIKCVNDNQFEEINTDPNKECKEAFDKGLTIQFRSKKLANGFHDCTGNPSWLNYNDYRVKPSTPDYTNEVNAIVDKAFAEAKPNTFTTKDGVEIRIGIDRCYAIKQLDDKVETEPSPYYGDDSTLVYFSSKDKADLYLLGLKDSQLQLYIKDATDGFSDSWIDISYDFIDWTLPIESIRVKPIECFYNLCMHSNTNSELCKTCNDKIEGSNYTPKSRPLESITTNERYRVKPTPTIIPYTTPQPHLKDLWFIAKGSTIHYRIDRFDSSPDTNSNYEIDDEWYSNEELFNYWTHVNGSLIGQESNN